MTQPVSVVVPSLFDKELIEQHMPRVLREIERRDVGDELMIVDDTGTGNLAEWLRRRFPAVRAVARETNGGFAQTLFDGVESAAHELVFAMNPDILVHEGFLEPLIEALEDEEVHSAVPKILLFGKPDEIESLTEIVIRDDLAHIRQRGLEGQAANYDGGPNSVAYAIGGGMLIRRDEFLAGGGFDRLYDPFYYEDVDLGVAAWRAGKRVVYRPDSVVEHHHRGTIGKRVDRALVRAVIERNRLLFLLKYVDDDATKQRTMAALRRWAIDAYLRDEREELVWLQMALDRLGELERSRRRMGPAERSWAETLDAGRPR